jgi:hypothetical protein
VPRLRDLGLRGNGSLYVLILLAYLALAHISLRTPLTTRIPMCLLPFLRTVEPDIVASDEDHQFDVGPIRHENMRDIPLQYYDSHAICEYCRGLC